MSRELGNSPFEPEVTVSLKGNPGEGAEITIAPNPIGADLLQSLATQRTIQLGRKMEISDVVIESLRLESLLADGKLLVRHKRRYRELLGA